MKILHHNDADGYAAAYLVQSQYENSKREIELIEMDYSKEVPFDRIKEDELVFIVDFSISPENMTKLLEKTKKVIWIDHHKSAIEEYEDFEEDIDGIRVVGLSGAALTYLFLVEGWSAEAVLELRNICYNEKEFVNTLKESFESAPKWLKLVNDWDVWDLKYPQSEQLQIAIANNLSIEVFEQMDNHSKLPDLLRKGKTFLEYRAQWSEQFMKKYGFERDVEFKGQKIKCFVANIGNSNSKFFGDRIKDYDMLVTYCYNGEEYTYSLYSDKENVDCSAIAKASGGGGHKGASGFSSPLDFEHWRLEV